VIQVGGWECNVSNAIGNKYVIQKDYNYKSAFKQQTYGWTSEYMRGENVK